MTPNGFVLWEGASRINGAPAVAIVTGTARPTANRKTGDMLQTWILRADVSPVVAVQSGADGAVCGGCRFRPALGGGCYVNVGQAPLAVYRAYTRGAYPYLTGTAPVAGRRIRFGAYGDPCAAPLAMWQALARAASGHTGYTHQWRARRFAGFAGLLQASCDSPDDVATAVARGFGTFRVTPVGALVTVGAEVVCPAPAVTCADCLACDGHGALIVIEAHGSQAGKVS